MELVLLEKVEQEEHLKELYELLVLGDQEFIPPLSSRASTTQQSLGSAAKGGGLDAYFNEMKQQCFVLALEEGHLAGFMSFKKNYRNPHIPEGENLYASTCMVHPDFRGRGLMRLFYTEMIRAFPTKPIYTRTWHENIGHLKVLERLGFSLLCTLENDRGAGVHTVYYGRQPK